MEKLINPIVFIIESIPFLTSLLLTVMSDLNSVTQNIAFFSLYPATMTTFFTYMGPAALKLICGTQSAERALDKKQRGPSDIHHPRPYIPASPRLHTMSYHVRAAQTDGDE
jgi:hypothetical protein